MSASPWARIRRILEFTLRALVGTSADEHRGRSSMLSDEDGLTGRRSALDDGRRVLTKLAYWNDVGHRAHSWYLLRSREWYHKLSCSFGPSVNPSVRRTSVLPGATSAPFGRQMVPPSTARSKGTTSPRPCRVNETGSMGGWPRLVRRGLRAQSGRAPESRAVSRIRAAHSSPARSDHASACARSATMSSGCSMPTDRRIMLGRSPATSLSVIC